MGNTVTIDLKDLNLDLDKASTYTIEIEEGFVSSAADSSTNNSQSENYTTDANGPLLGDTTPDLGETNSFAAIIEFVYPVRLRVTSGNFYLYKDGSPDELIETIPYNSNRVNVTENKIRLNVSGLLDDLTTYYILSDNEIISNLIGLESGITNEDVIKWTTGLIAPAPINVNTNLIISDNITSQNNNVLENRDFLGSQRNDIFASNQLSIVNDLGLNYRITLSTVNGYFGKSSSAIFPSVSFSGSASSVEAELQTYGYYPTNLNTSNKSFTFKLEIEDPSAGYVLLEKFDIDLIYTGEGSFDKTITFTTSQSWSPDAEDVLYSPIYDLLVVAGGGGSTNWAGGGGGQVYSLLNDSLTISAGQIYNIVVGQGGNANTETSNINCQTLTGGTGGTSSAFGRTSQGGTGASSFLCLQNYPPEYPDSPYVTTWNIQGGDSPYNGGTYNGYDQDAYTVFYQKSFANEFYNGPGAGAGGPAATGVVNQPGPGITAWDGVEYSQGGGDGNDGPTKDYSYVFNNNPGDGGYGRGTGDTNFAPTDGVDGIVKLRIRSN
jgi:hypothetical protein